MTCDNSKCQAWLCVLRSRALDSLNNSNNSTNTSLSCQHSLLASPSSFLQDHLNNSVAELSAACDYKSRWPLHCSTHHNQKCSTTQSLRDQLGADATSESFAWTSALETPAKSVQLQDPSLQDQSLGASFTDLKQNVSHVEKCCITAKNNQICQEFCYEKATVNPVPTHKLCAQVAACRNFSKELHLNCPLSHQNSSPSSDAKISTLNKNNRIDDIQEPDLQMLSDNDVKSFHKSCAHILDSVSPKLKRRTWSNTLSKKVLARTLFKDETVRPSDCTKSGTCPVAAESRGEEGSHQDETIFTDVCNAVDTNLANITTRKVTNPCSNVDHRECIELLEISRENVNNSPDAFMKESILDENTRELCELKKSPTIASRTPLNKLRKLPFKTSTPLLGTGLFSALRSHTKGILFNDEKNSPISASEKRADTPAPSDNDTSCTRLVKEDDREAITSETCRSTEHQIATTDSVILSPSQAETNPIDFLCSPVKKPSARANSHPSLLDNLMSSPVLSKKCTIRERSDKERALLADEPELESNGNNPNNGTNKEIVSPVLPHHSDVNVTSQASSVSFKDILMVPDNASSLIDSANQTLLIRSLGIKADANELSTLPTRTKFGKEFQASVNESVKPVSYSSHTSLSTDALVTSSASLVLRTSESSCVAIASSASCVTPTDILVRNENIDVSNSASSTESQSSPLTTLTHRKPRRLSLSAQGAQKLEMLKKKINPNSNFIYPSPLQERLNRAKNVKISQSIHAEISSCSFIDADVTSVLPSVGKASMKCEHQTTRNCRLSCTEGRNTTTSTGKNQEGCLVKQSEVSPGQVPTSTVQESISSVQSRNVDTSAGCPALNAITSSHSRKSGSKSVYIELHQRTTTSENVSSHNCMNSEELAEVDDILQNCDFDFDDMPHLSNEKDTESKLHITNDTKITTGNSGDHASHSVDDGKHLDNRPASGSVVFQTGRGATVQVSKEAVANASKLWKETADTEASESRRSNECEFDSFAVPSVSEKFVRKSCSEITSPALHSVESTKQNSCTVNKEAVVPEIGAKNDGILLQNKTSENPAICAQSEGSRETSIGFSGFKTASGNDVKVNEEAMKKALRLWGECADLKEISSEAGSASSFSGFLTAGGKTVEANSLALAEAKSKLDKFDFTDLDASKNVSGVREVDTDAPGRGFVTASGKPTSVSAEAIAKAKRIWSDCDRPTGMSSATDLQPTFGGFSSSKGSRLPLSQASLLRAQRLWDECAQFNAPSDSSVASSEAKFDGFKTATGTRVNVSSKAIHAAKKLLSCVEETSSEQILLNPRKTEKMISNPVSNTPTARTSRKGFIKHKIDPKKISGVSSGLPEPNSYYSKVRCDLSRRIYPKTASVKFSSDDTTNDSCAQKPVMVNLSAEEKAILDSQLQDITEEFLNDDWNMEPEGPNKEIDCDRRNREINDENEGFVEDREKRKISFGSQTSCKRMKITSSLAGDVDAACTDATVPRPSSDDPVNNNSLQQSLTSVVAKNSPECNEEAKLPSQQVSCSENHRFVDDCKASIDNTSESSDSAVTLLPKFAIKGSNDSSSERNSDLLCSSSAHLPSFTDDKQLVTSENFVSSSSDESVNISRTISPSKKFNTGSRSTDIASEAIDLNSGKAVTLQVSSSNNLKSSPDSDAGTSNHLMNPSLKTGSFEDRRSLSKPDFRNSSVSRPPCGEAEICSKENEAKCPKADVSPLLVRSKQIKKKIEYLRDAYGTPKALSPLPTSPAVLRMPFRAPLKRKLN